MPDPIPAPAGPQTSGKLVLITGTGRSGTSTVSGTLHYLGLSVPGPHLGANESNPRGFFESSWAVDFHKEIARRAGIDPFDGSPTALDRAKQAVTPQLRGRLVEFLTEQARTGSQLVVKDPRSVWAQQLWSDAADEAGLEIGYLSMLRHPAETIGSRSTYYAKDTDDAGRQHYETASIGRWVNSSLVSERETRGRPRTFVPYVDLLADWRTTLLRVADELGLTYDTDLTAHSVAAVDDFIDPDLRRVRVTWDDLEIPAELRAVAQRVWDDLATLSVGGGADPATSADLDECTEVYGRLFEVAAAISHDSTGEAVREAARKAARDARKKVRAEMGATTSAELGSGVGAGRERQGRLAPAIRADQRVRDTTSRDLLGTVRDRVLDRLRRRPGGRQDRDSSRSSPPGDSA